MLAGLRVVAQGIKAVWMSGYTYVWANLAFVILALPIVTLPAAFSGLMRVGHMAIREPGEADLDLFWETFKSNLGRGLMWGIAHAVFAFVNFFNLFVYQGEAGLLTDVLRTTWVFAGIVWVGVLFYTWPIYYEMEHPSLIGATRNALIMVLQNPFFTLTLLTGMLCLAILSTILLAAWLLLTWGFFAAMVNLAVLDRFRIVTGKRL